MRIVNRRLAAGVSLALMLGSACGGKGSGTGSSPTSVGSRTPGARTDLVPAQIIACHKRHDFTIDIQLRFNLTDRGALAEYLGELDYHATLTSPTAWTTTSATPDFIDRPHNQVFHLIVPEGEPVPVEIRLKPTVVALEDAVTFHAGSLAALAGMSQATPFGPVQVSSAVRSAGHIQVRLSIPSKSVSQDFIAQGAGVATMTVGPGTLPGTLQPSVGAETVAFPDSTSSGPVSLTLSNWTFASMLETVAPVPVAVCQAG